MKLWALKVVEVLVVGILGLALGLPPISSHGESCEFQFAHGSS